MQEALQLQVENEAPAEQHHTHIENWTWIDEMSRLDGVSEVNLNDPRSSIHRLSLSSLGDFSDEDGMASDSDGEWDGEGDGDDNDDRDGDGRSTLNSAPDADSSSPLHQVLVQHITDCAVDKIQEWIDEKRYASKLV